MRVELRNIASDLMKIGKRGFSPNNRDHFGLGQGSSFGVPHDLSHLTTSS
jgi:hypothetical protein